jgi:predicted  nucleic acid-binding Zn-ribbon protein
MICKFNFFSIKTTTLVLLSTFSSNLPAKLPEAPNLFKEWVTTERMISKESSNWDTEKEAIGDLIELLEEEIQNIDEKLNTIEEKNTDKHFTWKYNRFRRRQ